MVVTMDQVTSRIFPAPEVPAVIVGSAPGRSGSPAWETTAKSTEKLAGLVGCNAEDVRRHFGLANLCPRWRGTDQPTREHFRQAALRACGAASASVEDFVFVPGFRYILAGNEVVRALGKWARPQSSDMRIVGYGLPECSWYVCRGGYEVAAIPHPSPRNWNYNDDQLRGRVELFLRSCAWRGRVPADEMWRARPTASGMVLTA